jgi:CHAT domain-containing protein
LPWSEAEARALAHLARTLHMPAAVRIGVRVSRTWLIEALEHAQVVDAACHGDFRDDEFLRSALLLGRGEQVTLGELLSHQIDLRGLRLLILSACQTANFDWIGVQEEVRSLSVGALQAGAEAVLGSLWPVDDQATFLLIVRFAQEWFPTLHQEPPAAALARAQHWLRYATNRELERWRASELALQPGKFPPHPRQEVAESVVAVRGRGVRYLTHEAMSLLGEQTRWADPDACPYADPFYWAGFQITGW